MMATARLRELSSAAEIAVVPDLPGGGHQGTGQVGVVRASPTSCRSARQLLPVWVRTPVRLGVRQQTQLPRIALV